MTLKMFAVASTALLLAAAAAQAAPAPRRAATPAAAPSAGQQLPALTQGPPIAGICLYNRDAAIASSSAGKAMIARVQQLRAQAAAEYQGEQQSIKAEADALIAKKASLSQEQFQQQAGPIQQSQEASNRKAELRQRELQATGEKALQRFTAAAMPILRTLYEQHHCSLLLSGDVIMAANPAMDLTDQAVQQLNVSLPTMSFDRENLPQQ
jgi:Skp family chaperone for outer membrane proteins